jgi:Protein of unknown function (DUF1264)
MRKISAFAVLLTCCCLLTVMTAHSLHSPNSSRAQEKTHPPLAPSPADGYNVHVLAPHLVDGKAMGPYHHYCKVVAPDPQIVCLIYESTEPNAMLSQIEWIFAKKITRTHVPLDAWNKNWHDHAVEIAGGRVQVLDLPRDKAKEVADLVATTDGLIYHFYFDGSVPSAKMGIAQAVGHKPLSAAEYKDSQAAK